MILDYYELHAELLTAQLEQIDLVALRRSCRYEGAAVDPEVSHPAEHLEDVAEVRWAFLDFEQTTPYAFVAVRARDDVQLEDVWLLDVLLYEMARRLQKRSNEVL